MKKNKEQKKFSLEKVEVAKLNNSQMKNIVGGLVGDDGGLTPNNTTSFRCR